MNKLSRALLALGSALCTSSLFADFTLDLGAIDSSQTFILAPSNPANSDCSFELIDSGDNVVVSGSIAATVSQVIPSNNGPTYVYTYTTTITYSAPGVTIAQGGYMNTDSEISGLPTESYRIKCYAPWGNASTSVQLYGPYYYGGTTNFGAVDEYGSNLLFFDMFVF